MKHNDDNDGLAAKQAAARARSWLASGISDEEKQNIKQLLEDEAALLDAFGADLDFGTGGLRGVVGVGPNRMNRHTVAKASAAVANYLLSQQNAQGNGSKIVVGFDSRHDSASFARVAAEVFSSKGFWVFLFAELRPTPELSFAIRHLKASAGVMVTASHNPKNYNGFKVFWGDGAQVVAPHDGGIKKAQSALDDIVLYRGNPKLIRDLDVAFDDLYLARLKKLALKNNPALEAAKRSIRLVYTPLHGTGITVIPRLLGECGFKNVHVVREQSKPDGDFPTTPSPNPEDDSALRMALRDAASRRADLLLATDPDADRVRIGAGDCAQRLLSGNQIAALLAHYLLEVRGGGEGSYIVRSLVTTSLVDEIAADAGAEVFVVLTGFKHIGALIKRFEGDGNRKFQLGAEESYGYLMDDGVRDKDGVASCLVLSEMAAYFLAAEQKSLPEVLKDLFGRYGHYADRLVSASFEGLQAQRDLQHYMKKLRAKKHSMRAVGAHNIALVDDYQTQERFDHRVQKTSPLKNLPRSNVLQYRLENGDRITVRPSGTEPKMKLYLQASEPPEKGNGDFSATAKRLEARMDDLIRNWPKWG